MKKTLTINISGTIFNIDDDAYEKLNTYIDTLRHHFRHQEGSEEILEDIEIRISELLSEKIQEQKQVITIGDIDSIIEILGQPSDFIDQEDESSSQQSINYEPKPFKRLYRDPDNQVLGGVCSGLGAYFNVDAIWFRILFIILTMVGGSGMLIYFILWLAVPKALTTAEKLAMKGEKVTISNIEKSITDELGNIRDKINDMTSSSKQSYKKKEPQVRNVAESFLDILLIILKTFIRIILIIIGISLLAAGVLILGSFFGLLFGWNGFFMMEGPDIIDISINSVFSIVYPVSGAIGLYKLGFILFLAIPFLMIIYNAIRLIFKMDRVKYIGLAALNLWIFGLILTMVFAFKTVREFKYGTTVSEEISIETPSSNIIYLNIQDYNNHDLMEEGTELFLIDEKELYITDDGKYFNNVWFEVEESEDSNFHIFMHTFSRGKNPPDARNNAEMAQYPIMIDDSIITFNKFYMLDNYSPWRGQRIKLEIKVPEGKEIIMEKELENHMRYNNYHYDWHEWDDSPRNYWRSSFFQDKSYDENFSVFRKALYMTL